MLILAWIAAVGIPLGLLAWLVIASVRDKEVRELAILFASAIAIVGAFVACVWGWLVVTSYQPPPPAIVQPEAPR